MECVCVKIIIYTFDTFKIHNQERKEATVRTGKRLSVMLWGLDAAPTQSL